MSLILDALKRAERERRLTQPPDLTAVYDEDPWTRRGRPWFWLAGAFLIGAVAVGLILWSRGHGPDRVSPTTEISHPPAPTTDAAGKKKAPVFADSGKSIAEQPAQAPPQQTAPAAPQDPPASAMAEGVAKPPVQPLPQNKPDSDPAPAPQPSAPVKTPDTASPTPVEEPAGTPAAPPSPTVDAAPAEPATQETPAEEVALSEGQATKPPPPAPPPPQVETAPEASPAPAQPPAIPLISELPFEVREKLGKLQINVHSYSENPDDRMVFINMKRFRSGDRIGENGPVLKEITPEGAVIDYGEGQARLQVR
jgi:general secretion pathway protein B